MRFRQSVGSLGRSTRSGSVVFTHPQPMKKLLLSAILPFACIYALAQDTKPGAAATPAAPAAPATPAPAAGDVVDLTLGVIPNMMKFDKTELSVKAGAKVKLTFKNEQCF